MIRISYVLRIVVLLFVCMSVLSCSNKKQAKDIEKYSVHDSILLSNIRKYRKEIKHDRLLVLRFNKRNSDEFSFTIRYILNAPELADSVFKNKQYLYIDNKPIIVSDYINNRIVLGSKPKKIDSLFIKNVSPLLKGVGGTPIFIYEPVNWVVSYKNGQVEIHKCMVAPRGSSIYD